VQRDPYRQRLAAGDDRGHFQAAVDAPFVGADRDAGLSFSH
jgi:hypothetical protein